VRSQRQGAAIEDLGLLGAMLLPDRRAQIVQGPRVLRAEAQRLPQVPLRFAAVPLPEQGRPLLEISRCDVRTCEINPRGDRPNPSRSFLAPAHAALPLKTRGPE